MFDLNNEAQYVIYKMHIIYATCIICEARIVDLPIDRQSYILQRYAMVIKMMHGLTAQDPIDQIANFVAPGRGQHHIIQYGRKCCLFSNVISKYEKSCSIVVYNGYHGNQVIYYLSSSLEHSIHYDIKLCLSQICKT